jgi:hypothetical protein
MSLFICGRCERLIDSDETECHEVTIAAGDDGWLYCHECTTELCAKVDDGRESGPAVILISEDEHTERNSQRGVLD